MSKLTRILTLLAVCTALAPARAQAPTPPPQTMTKSKVVVDLLADVTAIAPGETFRLGVRLRPEAHWHVYWKFPGDTGIPTSVTFESGHTDGFDFGTIAWPTPSVFRDKIGGRSFAFEDELLLVSEVRVPDTLAEGHEEPFEAKVGWLVCKENCIQGSARVGLTLPVKNLPAADRRSPDAARFDTWRAKLPAPQKDAPPWSANVEGAPVPYGAPFKVTLDLTLPADTALVDPVADTFLPATEGLELTRVSRLDAPSQAVQTGKTVLLLEGKASSQPEHKAARLEGVLRLTRAGAPLAYDLAIDIPRDLTAPAIAALPTTQSPSLAEAPRRPVVGDPCRDIAPLDASDNSKLSSFALALLFAFLGGLILNGMPCVLPVLSLKLLGLVEQTRDTPQKIWHHGLFYTAGVLASFLVMAILLIALQQGSWAFQFQDPTFVGVFTAIVFAFALSLFGVFELSLPGASRLDMAVASSHGYASSFNYGIFAVLLGTPCTAPFLGPALTYAFTQPPLEMTALLLTVGLGLASPFLVLARFPGWRRILPKPGAWLLTFKKVMAFFLVGTAVFLLSIFAEQVSTDALVSYLVFLAMLSFALFVYGHWTEPSRSTRTRYIAVAVAVGLTTWASLSFFSTAPPPARAATEGQGAFTWRDFDRIDVNQKVREGHLVFIDFTASWCTTCKVNEATAIHTDAVEKLFGDLDVYTVKGDFTTHKPEIATWLARFDEPSVPLYVVIPPGKPDKAFKLPSLLSESHVLSGVCDAQRQSTP